MAAGCRDAAAPAAGDPKPRIINFYTNSPMLPKGEKALLCYGVQNAKALKLDPPVDRVWPALTRCIEVSPDQTTTYTLQASNDAGSAEQKVTIEVGGALPKLFGLSINATSVKAGEQISFCFKSSGAARVTAGPGRLQLSGPGRGCLFDRPAKTTTYTVAAENAGGQTASESVTVTVK